MTRDLLAGRLSRVRDRYKIGADGEPVLDRPHTPGDRAHRQRPMRFLED